MTAAPRRLTRLVLLVAGGLLATAALLVLAALALMQTRTGSELVLDRVRPSIDRAIAGDLQIGRLRASLRRLELTDVRLYDPEGRLVAGADRIEARFSPVALARGRLELDRVIVRRPRLSLVSDARGLNLARALKGPDRGERPADDGSPPPIRLERLELTEGEVEFVRVGADSGPRRWRLNDVVAEARGQLDLAAGSGEVQLQIRGAQVAPFPAQLALAVDGRLRNGLPGGEVEVRLGDSRLSAELSTPGPREQLVRVQRLALSTRLIRALVTPLALAGGVGARGEIRRAGDMLALDLDLQLAGGHLQVDGRLDLDRLRTPGLRVVARDLDVSALLSGAPETDLHFTLEAQGGGRRLATADGQVSLKLAPGRIAGQPAGPLQLQLRLAGGEVQLEQLAAALPGARVVARGLATRRRVDLTAELIATDLGQTADSFAGADLPLGGRGRLRARVVGPWAAPALEASGRFQRLRVQEQRARNLSLRVRVPNVRRPWTASGTLHAGRATLADRAIERLGVRVATTDGRSFSARASLVRPLPLTVVAAGRWAPAPDTLRLTGLRIQYPGTTWRLMSPAQLSFAEGLAIRRLRLAAGAQRLALDLVRRADHLTADLDVENLAPSRLPAIARPPGVPLAGPLDAHLRARLGEHRLSGRLRARAPAGQLQASFDLPVAFPPPRRAALRLHIDASSLALERLLDPAGPGGPRVTGQARLTVDVEGTAAAPVVEARASIDRLTAGGRPVGDLSLHAAARPGRPLTADVNLRSLGRPGRLHLEIPVELPALLRDPPAAAQLMRLPFHMTAELDRLPLGPLARLAGGPRKLDGEATLRLSVDGPAGAPTGSLELQLIGLRGPALPSTDAHLTLTARDSGEGIRAQLAVTRGDRQLATARGHLALPPARLAQPAALAAAPIEVQAELGPVRLQRLVAPADGDQRRPRTLLGSLQGSVRLAGTLAAPRLAAHAQVHQATLAGVPLGDAVLLASYADRQPRLELRLDGSDGGRVRLTVEARADLGYPAVLAGIAPGRLPLQAQLEADRYDLTPLGCLSDVVRVVEGRLDARARLDGPLASPQIQGRVEWTDGRVVLAGAGDYRQIHLLAHGDEARLVLDELTARSGDGTARLTAVAERRAGRRLALDARAVLRRFPVYADGQRVAAVTAEPRVTGQLSARQTSLVARLEEAHVQLATGRRPDVQSLRRPPDVVLYWGDDPLNRAQARKHQALVEARRALLAGGQGGDDGGGPVAGGDVPRGAPPLRVEVNAPNNLWIRGSDVNIELGLGPDFVLLARPEPAVFGTVFIRRGQVEVLGRRFRLDPGSTVRFNGAPDQPTLQVRAIHQPRHAQLTVVVDIEGTPGDIGLSVSSPERPELGQSDLLTVLLTGRPPDEGADMSPTAGAQAASLLGGFLADRLQQTLMRRLPIDVLNIDPGDSLRGTQLEAGAYLGDDFYVAYVGRFGAEDPFLRENQNELQLEYRLSQRWSFEASYGDARRGSADLVWTRRY